MQAQLQSEEERPMAMDTGTPRTRRAVLLGVGGAIAALAAQALARPLATRAEGEAIVVGGEYTDALSLTKIKGDISEVLRGESTGSGPGVHGVSHTGIGVFGESYTDAGIGVFGVSIPGTAMHGLSHQGTGVFGQTKSGIAIEAYVTGSGQALVTDGGRVRFKQVSGVATIAAGATTKTVTPGVDIVAASFVLLTPRANLGGRDLWYTTNPGSHMFSVHLSSARPSPTKIAWLLLG
jgi:hypothetical protein